MIDQRLSVGPLQCNCRLLACPETGEAVVVDPGDEYERILLALQGMKTPAGQPIRVKYLLHTHAHFDHIAATAQLKRSLGLRHPAVISLHSDDEELYRALPLQGQMFGFQFEVPSQIEKRLQDDEVLEVGQLRISVIHTPGHSPGGVCFRIQENSEIGASEQILSGDTLFQGSVGRTDLWGGDSHQLISSIRKRLLVLDGDIPVCPGHGPDTRIGVEKRENPFLK